MASESVHWAVNQHAQCWRGKVWFKNNSHKTDRWLYDHADPEFIGWILFKINCDYPYLVVENGKEKIELLNSLAPYVVLSKQDYFVVQATLEHDAIMLDNLYRLSWSFFAGLENTNIDALFEEYTKEFFSFEQTKKLIEEAFSQAMLDGG